MATENKEDKFKKFEGDGLTIKAKLVGTELVMEPRGDKMCQSSIARLKAIIKGQKAHKQRIVMKINYSGVKILDEKTNEILHQHEVPQISFIASDDTDSRTFGYVCDVPNKAHQFICFKTSGPAVQVMSVISSLFEAVLEQKKKREAAAGGQLATGPKEAGLVSADEPKAAAAPAAPQPTRAPPAPPASNKLDLFALDEFNTDFGDQVSADSAGSNTKLDPFNLSGVSSLGSTATNDFSNSSTGTTNNNNNNNNSSSSNSNTQRHHAYHQLGATNSPVSRAINIAAPNSNRAQAQPQQVQHSSSFLDERDPFGDSAVGLRTSKSIGYFCDQFGELVLGANNYSSVSLNETARTAGAGLPRQFSFAGTSLTNNNNNNNGTGGSSSNNNNSLASSFSHSHNDSTSCADKYAAFNEIDNLPSIFESTSSLNSSRSKLSGGQFHITNTGGNSGASNSNYGNAPLGAAADASSSGSAHGLNFSAPLREPAPLPAGPRAAPLTRQLTNPFDDDFFA